MKKKEILVVVISLKVDINSSKNNDRDNRGDWGRDNDVNGYHKRRGCIA